MKKMFLRLFFTFLFAVFGMFAAPAEAYLEQLSPQSFNALYDLASRGNVSAINNARSRGLNIDSVNANGDTGLCVAAKYKNRQAFKSFLQSGANPYHRCTWEISGYRDFLRSVVEKPVKNMDTALVENKGLLSSMSFTTKALIGAGVIAAGVGTAVALGGGGGGGGKGVDPNCVHGHWVNGVCVCNSEAYTGDKCDTCAPGYDHYGTNECYQTLACANGGYQQANKCVCPAAYADGNLCEGCGPGYGRGTDGKCVGIEVEKVVGNEGQTNTNYNSAGNIVLDNTKYTTVYGLFYDADNTPTEIVIDQNSFANGYFSVPATEKEVETTDYTRDSDGNVLWYKTDDQSSAAGYINSSYEAYSYDTASIIGWADSGFGGYTVKKYVEEQIGTSKITSADYAWNGDGSLWWYKEGEETPSGYLDAHYIAAESILAYGSTGTDPIGTAYKDTNTYIYQVKDDTDLLGTAAPSSRTYAIDGDGNLLWYETDNPSALGYIDSSNNAYSYATSGIVGWATLDSSGLHIVKHNIVETIGNSKWEEIKETKNFLVLNKSATVDITNTSDSIVYGLYSPKVDKIYNIYVSLEAQGILVSDLTTYGQAHATSTIHITNSGNGNVYGIYGNNAIYSGDFSAQSVDEESQTGILRSYITIENQGDGEAYGIYNGKHISSSDSTESEVTPGIYHQIKSGSKLSLYSYTTVSNSSGKGNTYGLYSLNAITNSGIVSSIADAGSAYGLYNTGGTITNATVGSIEDSVTAISATGNAYGAYIKDGTITNGRVITATTTAGTGTAYGIYATQSEGKQTTVTNNSGLTVTSFGGDAYGIYNKGGEVTNTTDYYPIKVTATNGAAYGIYSDGGTVTNSGHIYVYGPSQTKTYGIYATNGATVKNKGNFVFLVGIAGQEDQTLDWRDEAAYCTNCTALTTPNGGYAVYLTNGAKFDNSGSLTTTSSLSLGKGVSVSKGGSFSATSISGDLTVSNEVVTSGFENKYILEDAILTDDASALTLSSESALFDATLSGSNIVLTKKNFADVLQNNASVAAFLEQNYALQNSAELFESLKQKTNVAQINDVVSKLTGQDVFSRFSAEDLLMEKEFNFDLTEKMFNLKGDVFSLSENVKPQMFSGKSSSTQYTLSGVKTKDSSFGVGLAVSEITSDDGHRHNNRTSKHIQLLMPFETDKNGLRFLSHPKLGYAYGTYNRDGYEGQSFKGKIEKRTFAVANAVRYPVRFGAFELSPAFELNLSAIQTKLKEDAKPYSLSSSRQQTYSTEAGFGAYLSMQKDLSKTSRLSFNAGAALYHEFANPYDLTLSMNNSSGSFKLTDENRRDEYVVLRSKFTYDFGNLSFYGNFLSYIDSAYRTRADLGFKYAF